MPKAWRKPAHGYPILGPLLEATIDGLLALPAWLVIGIPGAFIAWLGRTRRARVFVKQDQF